MSFRRQAPPPVSSPSVRSDEERAHVPHYSSEDLIDAIDNETRPVEDYGDEYDATPVAAEEITSLARQSKLWPILLPGYLLGFVAGMMIKSVEWYFVGTTDTVPVFLFALFYNVLGLWLITPLGIAALILHCFGSARTQATYGRWIVLCLVFCGGFALVDWFAWLLSQFAS